MKMELTSCELATYADNFLIDNFKPLIQPGVVKICTFVKTNVRIS